VPLCRPMMVVWLCLQQCQSVPSMQGMVPTRNSLTTQLRCMDNTQSGTQSQHMHLSTQTESSQFQRQHIA
jgi:hypothetical protein